MLFHAHTFDGHTNHVYLNLFYIMKIILFLYQMMSLLKKKEVY